MGQARAKSAGGRAALLPPRPAQQYAHLHSHRRKPAEEVSAGRGAPSPAHAG